MCHSKLERGRQHPPGGRRQPCRPRVWSHTRTPPPQPFLPAYARPVNEIQPFKNAEVCCTSKHILICVYFRALLIPLLSGGSVISSSSCFLPVHALGAYRALASALPPIIAVDRTWDTHALALSYAAGNLNCKKPLNPTRHDGRQAASVQ